MTAPRLDWITTRSVVRLEHELRSAQGQHVATAAFEAVVEAEDWYARATLQLKAEETPRTLAETRMSAPSHEEAKRLVERLAGDMLTTAIVEGRRQTKL